nr:hypothetical protein [Angustibacter aerolatus]
MLGGEFPKVNNVRQQGLVRFAVRSKAPNTSGPVVKGRDLNPTTVSLSAGSVRITWPANWDRDNEEPDLQAHPRQRHHADLHRHPEVDLLAAAGHGLHRPRPRRRQHPQVQGSPSPTRWATPPRARTSPWWSAATAPRAPTPTACSPTARRTTGASTSPTRRRPTTGRASTT